MALTLNPLPAGEEERGSRPWKRHFSGAAVRLGFA